MSKWIFGGMAFLVVLVSSVALAQPEAAAPNVVSDVGNVVDAVRTGSWIAIASAVIMLLGNLFRAPWLGGVTKKIPKRWRIAVPIVLGGLSGMLAHIVGGMPWPEAIMISLFTGPSAVFQHELFVEQILGKSKTREATSG